MRGLFWTLLISCAAFAPGAWASSALVLPYPTSFGLLEAATYDADGSRLGKARFEVEELLDGRVRMTVRTGIDQGASNEASILLAPVAGRRGLRAVEQRSESRNAAGQSLGVLHVDHEAGVGSCTPASGTGSKSIELPDHERIANVALNLLFRSIAAGDASREDFQVFVCLGGPRVVDFSAAPEPRANVAARADQVVEIRYQPDLSPAIQWLAGGWMPQYSFWLDGDGNYLAHRIPLYTRGPEVLVVRDGISPLALDTAP